MSDWVTLHNKDEEEVSINLSLATVIAQRNKGSRIFFVGAPDDSVDVMEDREGVLDELKTVHDAHRT